MLAVMLAAFRFLIIINVEAIIWALKILKEFIVGDMFKTVNFFWQSLGRRKRLIYHLHLRYERPSCFLLLGKVDIICIRSSSYLALAN